MKLIVIHSKYKQSSIWPVNTVAINVAAGMPCARYLGGVDEAQTP
jgi:hypothetical protein